MNPYQYGSNNPLTYTDPTGLDTVSTVSTASDVVGIAAGATEEASLWGSLAGVSAPASVNAAAGVAGKVTAGVSVGIKTYEFVKDPSSATGGQLANETAKTLTGFAAPPVGLIWAVLDLTGYGPSSILENTEKTIQAHKAAAAAYRRAAAASRETARIINEATPRLEAQQRHVRERLGVLEKETAKLNQKTSRILKGDTRTLEELNAEIARYEKMNRRSAGELKRIQAHVRKLQE